MRGNNVQQPSTWYGRPEQILLNQVGCETRKIPPNASVFFLDFPFYRTYQAVTKFLFTVWCQLQIRPQKYCFQSSCAEDKSGAQTSPAGTMGE